MKVEAKVAASFVLALLAVLLVGSLIYGNNRALLRHNAQVVHTYQVLDRIGEIFDAAQEIESGMRGYVLTGRPEFLDVYQKSIDGLAPRLKELSAQVSDNPAQLARVATLDGIMRRKIAVSQERVDQRRTEGIEAVVSSFDGRGKATMDELRRHIAEMRNTELALLDQRMSQSASSARRVITAYGVLLGVAVLLLGIFFIQVRNDLRERVRVSALLETNERRFRGVMESAPDAMAVTDQAGRITMTNSAFAVLFSVPAAEAQGRPLADFLHRTEAGREDDEARKLLVPDDASADLHTDAASVSTTGQAELGVRRRSQELTAPLFLGQRVGQETPFPAEVTRSTLRAADGGDGTTITAIRDLTERVEAEGELRKYSEDLARSNTELERFAYVASHDLQEPLRMVSSYTQLLGRRYRGKLGADADEFIEFAVDGANRMQKLINDLLAYSRVGSRPIEQLPVDCDALLTRVQRDMHDTLAARGATVEHDPLPIVRGDATQLSQLFQNLLGNATKFQQPETLPVVRFTVSEEPGASKFWRFSCQDNGIGIDPQYFERIFVIFQRLHGKEQYSGTGIGLAICKKIVERHGGRLWVESELGRGANFLFTLPAVDV